MKTLLARTLLVASLLALSAPSFAQTAPDAGQAEQADQADETEKAPTPAELQAEIDDQQAQLDALQQQLADRQEALDQLGNIDQGIQGLTDQVATGQEAVEARAQASDTRVAQLQQAIELLRGINLALSQGTTDVDADLADAEDLLEGVPRDAVSAARASLDEGDLYNARVFIHHAMTAGMANALQGTGRASAY